MLFDLAKDPDEKVNLAQDPEYRPILEGLRARIREVWDFEALNPTILASQTKRRLVAAALKKGVSPNWDFVPHPDYSDLYVRSANSHEVIDRKVRIAAKGYALPKNQ